MKINNPEVTLKDEARTGVKKSNRNGLQDWLFVSVVKGDDGEFYEVGASIFP